MMSSPRSSISKYKRLWEIVGGCRNMVQGAMWGISCGKVRHTNGLTCKVVVN